MNKMTINKKNNSYSKNPYPFLKWVGGKRQLISQIDPILPDIFGTYFEPFVGGGALFFYLLPKKAVLIDNNPVLINVYNVIKYKVDELIASLKNHKNEKDYYYKIRNVDREEEFKLWNDVQKASRTIFLNRCCYNGLYRVNSKGQFNVPFGKYKNPRFCDEENLRVVNQILKNVDIINGSYEIVLKYAQKNDFIYFDPPYMPISKSANFTSYTKDNFSEKDQLDLKSVYDNLSKMNVKVMLSNSYCDFILDLYQEYRIEIVKAKRAVNSDSSKRGQIREVLILNY